jgi:hypothetical protein
MGRVILEVESRAGADLGFIVPLMQSAVERERRMLERSIERTMQALAEYEQRHGMSSREFYRKFNTGDELEDNVEFASWAGEVEMLRLLQEKYQALDGVQVHARQ